MNSSRSAIFLATILAIVALFLAVAAFLLGLSAKREANQAAEPGNSSPNIGEGVDRVLNAAERTRMESYVAELQASKKVIKSFPGFSGEIIDCVDVYHQPALKRKGMEGHVLQFAPTTQPTQSQDQSLKREEIRAPSQLYSLTGETCADKSIPMARLTMDTLKNFRTLDEFFQKKYRDIEKPTGGGSGSVIHEWAHAARGVDNWGAESNFNLWSPYNEQPNEFSLSQIWVTRGSGGDLETVEGGWQKFRDLYGDWRSHLFIYFTPDNYGSGGCYNTSCNGFVQITNSTLIGGSFVSSSEGGAQFEFKLLWYKDGRDGHWWLRYGDTWVGYYPRTLFDNKGLRNEADSIDFGGEIVNRRTDNRHTRTDMGSGSWPSEGFGSAAYQLGLRYVDTSNFYQRATGLRRSVSNSRCYDLSLSSSTGSWGEYFFFGGPGFNSSCP